MFIKVGGWGPMTGGKMDFGDILNQWDNLQKEEKKKQKESSKIQVSHKKANAPTKEEKEAARALEEEKRARESLKAGYDWEKEREKKINPMELWLRRYGTVDKDSIMETEKEREHYKSRGYLEEMKCDARLDLHGLTREEAWKSLEAFVADAQKRGFKKIMIVHGKGIHTKDSSPVLGETVRKFIEIDKRLGTSGHPQAREGGKGSTWVILKNNL